MPLVATCHRCTARFVADEAAGAGSSAGEAARPLCEACHRDVAEERLRNDRASFNACVGATVLFAAWALKAGVQPRPGDRVSWNHLLGTSVACGALAAFFFFCRVRPQLKLVAAAREADGERGESPNTRRIRQLHEAGLPLDWNEEHRALRRQSERLTKNLVDLGHLDTEVLRQERRRNRLLDQIDEVDEQLRLARVAVEPSETGRAALDKLTGRRTYLAAELARPHITWSGIVDRLLSLLAGGLVWLYERWMATVLSMAALVAFRQGRFGIAAGIMAVLLVKSVPVDMLMNALSRHRNRPTHSAGSHD